MARQPALSRRPSIGIRGPSSQSLRTRAAAPPSGPSLPEHDIPDRTSSANFNNRRRSSSDPRPYIPPQHPEDHGLARAATRPEHPHVTHMPTLREEGSARPSRDFRRPARDSGAPQITLDDQFVVGTNLEQERDGEDGNEKKGLASRAMNSLGRLYPGGRTRQRVNSNATQPDHPEYDAELVNLLDVIDPEVSTLSTLTNVQNSLFVPDLGRFINRRPTYNLSAIPQRMGSQRTSKHLTEEQTEDAIQEKIDRAAEESLHPHRDSDMHTIDSRMSESRYAVLPHGISLEGWTAEEKAELNDHVRHMLHSRRAAFKRGWKGFKQYVRRPLGFFVTLYATLITLFGFAWVLFLIGWVNLGARRDYIINVVDNVLVALFAVMGDGLIPFRTIDTYHMIYIAHYHHLTWRLRKERHLPKLPDHNDLPSDIPSNENVATQRIANGQPSTSNVDLEAQDRPSIDSVEYGQAGYYSVLSPEQQRKLEHHQTKFSKSHTFYKPHETNTHFAFPLRLLVAIVVLLDFHSIFQIALGTCTWAISYHTRPFTLTTVILICSISCNITGGILISIGDRRTRKKDVRERMFRQQLTEAGIKHIQKKKRKEEGVEAVPEVTDHRKADEILAETQKRHAAHLADI